MGVGLAKTGTTSLDEALRLLGYNSIHDPPLWVLEDGADAYTDASLVIHYKLLDRLYPCSKFIMTYRAEDSWLHSIEKHWARLDMDAKPAWLRFTWAVYRMQVFGQLTFDRDNHLSSYRRHVADVLNHFAVRPYDLLVFNICAGEGWDKLCPFLGKPIPDVPFPHCNVSPD